MNYTKLILKFRSLPSIALAAFSMAPASLYAVTICDETEIVISHPAEYIQEKVKRGGLSCLAVPHCCTPAWVTDPVCYLEKTVKKKDAWEEVKSTFTCENYDLDPETVWRRILANLSDPVPGFEVYPASAVSSLLGGYVQELHNQGDSVPSDIQNKLKDLSASVDFPFSIDDLDRVRWVPATNETAKIIYPSGVNAVTYYNLIIINESTQVPVASTSKGSSIPKIEWTTFTDPNDPLCARTALWAHELVHVEQYHRAGWDKFLNQWINDSLTAFGDIGHYNRLATEAPAYIVQEATYSECSGTKTILSLTSSLKASIEHSDSNRAWEKRWKEQRPAKAKEIEELIDSLHKEGKLGMAAGRITTMSDEARAALSEIVPEAKNYQYEWKFPSTSSTKSIRVKHRLPAVEGIKNELPKLRSIEEKRSIVPSVQPGDDQR